MDVSSEQWKSVLGYEGRYDVSSLGNVRSWSAWKRGALLAAAPSPHGYLVVHLAAPGGNKVYFVHHLVLAAFVGPRGLDQITRHLDGNRTNNRSSNLAWGTQSENLYDVVRHGNHPFANRTHCPHGHAYDQANTLVWSDGRRRCRTCETDRERRRTRGGR